jgi:hypothetical protein
VKYEPDNCFSWAKRNPVLFQSSQDSNGQEGVILRLKINQGVFDFRRFKSRFFQIIVECFNDKEFLQSGKSALWELLPKKRQAEENEFENEAVMPIVWLPNEKTEPVINNNNTEYSAYHSSGSQEYNSSPDDSSSNAMHVSTSDAEINESDNYQHYSYDQQYQWDYSQYHNSANTNQLPLENPQNENYMVLYNGNAEVIGNFRALNFYKASDINLKEDIHLLEEDHDCRASLLQIDGVEYKFKDGVSHASNKRFIGYIAQQIESVVPEAVQLIDGILHVDYESLIPYLSESIKQNYNDIKHMRTDVDRVNKVIDAMYEQYVKSLKGQNPQQSPPQSPIITKAESDVRVTTNWSLLKSTRWLKVAIAMLVSVVAALGLVMVFVILPGRETAVPTMPLQPHTTDNSENLNERAIVVELYYALDGPHWISTFWPVEDKRVSHCSWKGIECDDAERITGIFLLANMFNGTVPASIGNLKNLKELWLAAGHINEPLPESISHLPKLEKLQVSYANMAGYLPDLHNLTSLRTISFDGNNFNGTLPEHYLQLPYIEKVDLSLLHLTGTLPQWISSSLQTLDLSMNDIQSTIPDYSSSNLKFIDLSFNMFYGNLPPLGRNVQSILLPRNYLNGTFDGSGYKQLKTIDLRSNDLRGAFDLPAMNVSSLSHVDISGNHFTSFFRNTPVNPIVAKYCKATDNVLECPILTWVSEKCEVECDDSVTSSKL